MKRSYCITACYTENNKRCVFPFIHDGLHYDKCYLDKSGNFDLYLCPEDSRIGIGKCEELCPVECERGKSYMCEGKCIPMDIPCNGKCEPGNFVKIVGIIFMNQDYSEF